MKQTQTHNSFWEVSLATFVVLVFVAFALYPLLYVLTLALSPESAPHASAIPWPSHFSFDHFMAVFRDGSAGAGFFVKLWNSILVSIATATVALLLTTPAAYALSRFPFFGREGFEKSLFATQMFPGVAASVPLYLLLNFLGLLDTRTGLVLVYAASAVPFSLFQLRAAFDAIPRELDEAAMVDGATRFQAFVKVILPAARPAIAVTGLFAFMTAWNEFILAATLLSRTELHTLPIVVSGYASEYNAQLGKFAASALIASLPVVVLFYFIQRYIGTGVTQGAVKG